MFVVKRDGRQEPVQFDKIQARISSLRTERELWAVDPASLAQKVIKGLYSGVTTAELDTLAAETAASKILEHPDFSRMAAALEVSSLHKEVTGTFSEVIRRLSVYQHPITGKPAPLIDAEVAAIVATHAAELDAAIDYNLDYDFTYFGFKVLEKSYLLRMNGKVATRPQDMFMRVAVGMHKNDIPSVLQCYRDMAQRYFIHATPTLFNAGTPHPQMSSCFLLTVKGDSIDGIFDTLKDCATISKHAGGIGVSMHKIRASHSYIAGTNGKSNGLVPMLQVYNNTARYVDQGGGKRKGSFAIYLEPWHADVEDFLELRKTHGKEEVRARDLFYALWIPDLFMQRIEDNGDWSLFCPNEAPGLADVWGAEFETLYHKYEQTPGLARKTVKARDLWTTMKRVKRETGLPYFMFKDTCNRLSNQQHLGTIRSSNLCCEIIEYTAPDEIAVCNLASQNLSKYVYCDADGKWQYDFDDFIAHTRQLVKNLNRVIDANLYPVPEGKKSNLAHRPIGIGVQALADTFAMMKMPFDSPDARLLNKQIFAAMYYGAVVESVEEAKVHGAYDSFAGSPASQGKFHFDLANVEPLTGSFGPKCQAFDWETLRADMVKYGLRNSLLIALMPTASTSQIMGNNECFEPFTSNAYSRRVLAGEFTVQNEHMVRDLMASGHWTDHVRTMLVANNGSLQSIEGIPDDIKARYKTVWEIRQSAIYDMAIDRQPYIDQAQSMNAHMKHPTLTQLDTLAFKAWKGQLKCAIYYLRTRPRVDPVKVTVDHGAMEIVHAQTSGGGGGGGASNLPDCDSCGS